MSFFIFFLYDTGAPANEQKIKSVRAESVQ